MIYAVPIVAPVTTRQEGGIAPSPRTWKTEQLKLSPVMRQLRDRAAAAQPSLRAITSRDAP